MHISPDGYGFVSLVYFISGISSNLYSTPTPGPPTWPDTGSNTFVAKDAPHDSVYPYASTIGQQKTHLKNANTFGAIGADAVIIILTLPPSLSLAYENTKLSKSVLFTHPYV